MPLSLSTPRAGSPAAASRSSSSPRPEPTSSTGPWPRSRSTYMRCRSVTPPSSLLKTFSKPRYTASGSSLAPSWNPICSRPCSSRTRSSDGSLSAGGACSSLIEAGEIVTHGVDVPPAGRHALVELAERSRGARRALPEASDLLLERCDAAPELLDAAERLRGRLDEQSVELGLPCACTGGSRAASPVGHASRPGRGSTPGSSSRPGRGRASSARAEQPEAARPLVAHRGCTASRVIRPRGAAAGTPPSARCRDRPRSTSALALRRRPLLRGGRTPGA